jgi:GNAT superfamily N-acetyltransferase
MSLRILREPIPVEQFNALCRSVGWKEAAANHYDCAVRHSIACVHALVDGQIVGSGRLIGDIGAYLYIQDLIVHPDYQGQGIGGKLLQELHRIVAELGDSRQKIGLIAADDIVPFYERFGYSESQRPGKYLVTTIAQ